jgi:hypothetical protein
MNHTTSQPSPYLICSLQRGGADGDDYLIRSWLAFVGGFFFLPGLGSFHLILFFSPTFLFWVLCFIDASQVFIIMPTDHYNKEDEKGKIKHQGLC